MTQTSNGTRDGKAVNETERVLDNRVQSVTFNGVIANEPGTTTGTFEYSGLAASKPTRPFVKRGRTQFWPEFDEYALEMTIEDYAKWRPRGIVATPDKPGNNLTAKATVITKDGGEPPQVKAIRFALIDVSREPGVCLNGPPGATDCNPDLKLASAPMTPGALSVEEQRLEVKTPLVDEKGRPDALAQIDSYDFGARATLRVACELVSLSLPGIANETIEQGEPLRVSVRIKAPEFSPSTWTLAPASGRWADTIAVEILATNRDDTLARGVGVGTPDQAQAVIDRERVAGGLWRLGPEVM